MVKWALLTADAVRYRVDALRHLARRNPRAASVEAEELRTDALFEIAEGHAPNPQALAAAVLVTVEEDFCGSVV